MSEYSTAQDFIDQVRREIRDEDKLRHTDDDLISYLNRALRQVARAVAHLWPEYEMRTTLAPSKEYEMLLDLNGSSYQWSSSGSGTDEYYLEASGGGDPSINEPGAIYEDGGKMEDGTAGSLASGEWYWGDNDALGYNTVYVRLSGGADPDTKSSRYVEAGKVEYDLPTDLYEVMRITARDTVLPVLDYETEYLQGTRDGYILDNDAIRLPSPCDETGTLALRYIALPSTVTSPGDSVEHADEFPDVVTELMCIQATGTDDENWEHHSQLQTFARRQMRSHIARTNWPTHASLGIDTFDNAI